MSINLRLIGLLFIGFSLLISSHIAHSAIADTPIKNSIKSEAFKKLVKGLIADDYTRVLQALNEGAPYKTQRYKGRKS